MVSSPTPFPGGFTVLMAVYHGDDVDLFERAVRSVFDNTLRPNAFILVVDGLVPPSLAGIIKNLEAEFGLDVLSLSTNQGLARALNEGLDKVGTEWVVRADADDMNLPERFERLAHAAASPLAPDLIGSAIAEVDKDGSPLGFRRTPLSHLDVVRFAKQRNPFNHMTVAYRCNLARRCGGYPQIHLKEDYALWALMLREGAVALNLPEVLVHATAGRDLYRRRGGWRYARAEVQLQRHLVQCRIKKPLSALFDGLLRGAVFMFPAFLRGWVYMTFLRSQREQDSRSGGRG